MPLGDGVVGALITVGAGAVIWAGKQFVISAVGPLIKGDSNRPLTVRDLKNLVVESSKEMKEQATEPLRKEILQLHSCVDGLRVEMAEFKKELQEELRCAIDPIATGLTVLRTKMEMTQIALVDTERMAQEFRDVVIGRLSTIEAGQKKVH